LQDVKLLAFSDLHRDREAARELVGQAAAADLVVGAGDFASFRLGLGRTIDDLRAIEAPAILIPGNHESDTALWRDAAGWESASVLHGEAATVSGVEFFGLGGGIPPTPLPWSFDLTEEQAEAKLRSCPDGAVMVVHSPPRGHLDRAHGRSLGSRAILDAIETHRPPLVLCGHIHECWGRESRIGGSRVVNLGPRGRWFEV
jgi:Icc-related predicted phosphoesterase